MNGFRGRRRRRVRYPRESFARGGAEGGRDAERLGQPQRVVDVLEPGTGENGTSPFNWPSAMRRVLRTTCGSRLGSSRERRRRAQGPAPPRAPASAKPSAPRQSAPRRSSDRELVRCARADGAEVQHARRESVEQRACGFEVGCVCADEHVISPAATAEGRRRHGRIEIAPAALGNAAPERQGPVVRQRCADSSANVRGASWPRERRRRRATSLPKRRRRPSLR